MYSKPTLKGIGFILSLIYRFILVKIGDCIKSDLNRHTIIYKSLRKIFKDKQINKHQ